MQQHKIIITEELFDLVVQLSKKLQKNIGLEEYYSSVHSTLNAQARLAVLSQVEQGLGCGLRGKSILELGSGIGMLVTVACAVGLTIQGSEPSANSYDQQITATQCLLRSNGLSENLVVGTDGQRLPWPNNSFDIVLSFQVLEHVSDPAVFLREATRVLKPGGFLYIEMPNYLSFTEGHFGIFWCPLLVFSKRAARIWVKLFKRNPAFLDEITFVTPSRLLFWARQSGLRARVLFSPPCGRAYPSTEGHVVHAVWPSGIVIPAGQRYSGFSLFIKKIFSFPALATLLAYFKISEHIYLIAQKQDE